MTTSLPESRRLDPNNLHWNVLLVVVVIERGESWVSLQGGDDNDKGCGVVDESLDSRTSGKTR